MSYRYSFLVSSPDPKGHSELFLITLCPVNAAGILLIPFSSCPVTPQNTTKYHDLFSEPYDSAWIHCVFTNLCHAHPIGHFDTLWQNTQVSNIRPICLYLSYDIRYCFKIVTHGFENIMKF